MGDNGLLCYPHAHQSCYEAETSTFESYEEILNLWFIHEQLNNYKFDPLICGQRLFFHSFTKLPKFMKEAYFKKHENIISFEKFVKDYPKNRLHYELLKSMEGVK